VLQNSFWITEDNFSGCGRGERIIIWGTATTGDELTGNFGSALEDTSIGDCRLVALFAEKRSKPFLEFCNRIPPASGRV
jgi:hypothetical protein